MSRSQKFGHILGYLSKCYLFGLHNKSLGRKISGKTNNSLRPFSTKTKKYSSE
jgi:hypothetical protein